MPTERELNVARAFALVALTRSGRPRAGWHTVQLTLAAAVLADLALAQRITVTDDRIRAETAEPTRDGTLDQALSAVDRRGETLTAGQWLQELGTEALRRRVIDELVDDGHVRVRQARRFRVIPETRYPPVDDAGRRDLLEQLRRSLREPAGTDPRTGCVLGLAQAAGVLRPAVRRVTPAAVDAVVDDLRGAAGRSEAVRNAAAALGPLRAAVTAAVSPPR